MKFPRYCKKCENSIFPAMFSELCKNKKCGEVSKK